MGTNHPVLSFVGVLPEVASRLQASSPPNCIHVSSRVASLCSPPSKASSLDKSPSLPSVDKNLSALKADKNLSALKAVDKDLSALKAAGLSQPGGGLRAEEADMIIFPTLPAVPEHGTFLLQVGDCERYIEEVPKLYERSVAHSLCPIKKQSSLLLYFLLIKSFLSRCLIN